MINFIIRIIGVMASINGSNPFGQGSSPWWCANIVGELIKFKPAVKLWRTIYDISWRVAEWLKATDCKSVLVRVRGFKSLPSNQNIVGELIKFKPAVKLWRTIYDIFFMGVLSNWLARLIVAQVLIAWGFESLRSHFFTNMLKFFINYWTFNKVRYI